MVTFARTRTKSLISWLWPDKEKTINDKIVELNKSQKLIEDITDQNKCFLEASKNGGVWFS